MRCAILALSILCLCLSIAGAQDLGEVITVTAAEGGQQFPDVAYNGSDNTFLVVWEQAIDENFFDIHGVVLNGDTGQPLGDPVVLFSEPSSMEAPEIAYNRVDNEYLLVARRETDQVAFALRVSAQGQPIGDRIELGRSTGSTFFDPAARARVVSVVHNASDNKYAVGFGPPSVQILNADGSLDIFVDPFGTGTNPSIAWSSQSNVYLMAFEDREPRSTGAENLSAQMLSNTGDLVGELLFIRDQDFAEESPRIAYNPDDDQFLVVWDERIGFAPGHSTSTDTIGQIVAANGTLVGDPIAIEASTPYTLRQDVAYSSQSGAYLVVWKGDENPSFAFADINGRIVGRDGSLRSDIFLIFDNGDDDTDDGTSERYFDESKLPVVATNTQTGAFLVVWEEAGTFRDPFQRDILARFITLGETKVQEWQLFH